MMQNLRATVMHDDLAHPRDENDDIWITPAETDKKALEWDDVVRVRPSCRATFGIRGDMLSRENETHNLVRKAYGEVARKQSSCCAPGSSCCGHTKAYTVPDHPVPAAARQADRRWSQHQNAHGKICNKRTGLPVSVLLPV